MIRDVKRREMEIKKEMGKMERKICEVEIEVYKEEESEVEGEMKCNGKIMKMGKRRKNTEVGSEML